jgi:DoxX
MAQRVKLRHLPGRLSTGAFILNAGLGKLSTDADRAKQVHAMAANVYPALESMDPETFTKLLGAAEVALGGALILPFIPSRLAGLGLAAFSAGLLGLYLQTPGMREEGSIRPSQQGTPLAKDVWMLGIALGLILDSRVTKKHKG